MTTGEGTVHEVELTLSPPIFRAGATLVHGSDSHDLAALEPPSYTSADGSTAITLGMNGAEGLLVLRETAAGDGDRIMAIVQPDPSTEAIKVLDWHDETYSVRRRRSETGYDQWFSDDVGGDTCYANDDVMRSLPVGFALTNKLYTDQCETPCISELQESETITSEPAPYTAAEKAAIKNCAVASAAEMVEAWIVKTNMIYSNQLNFRIEVADIVVSDGSESWENYETDDGICTRLWEAPERMVAAGTDGSYTREVVDDDGNSQTQTFKLFP